MSTPAPVTYRHGGLVCTDHTLDVPLDHSDPEGPALALFAREVVAEGREHEDLPRLLWLQGGPGGRAERPSAAGAWLRRALTEYRVVLLDQRGTGRSTPADRRTLARFGTDHAAAAGYLAHFRADSIVRDAELLRRRLQGEQPWSVLGQSFGGFTTLTYLSLAPEGLTRAYITGGLPTLTGHADDVYRAAYARTLTQNERYFDRYPGDQALADAVAAHLASHDVRMPTGERLTVRRFQTLGITFGTASKSESLHYLLETAFTEGADGPELTDTFLRGVDAAVSFAERPCTPSSTSRSTPRAAAPPTGRRTASARSSRPSTPPPAARCGSPARWSTPGSSRRTPRSYRCAAPRRRSPPARTGRPCTTWTGSPPTRSRSSPPSTTTTCSSTGSRPLPPPTPYEACAPGSPTPTRTTGSGPTPPCWTG